MKSDAPTSAPAARHPLWLTLLTSLWLVGLPNLPLWRQLAQLPEVTGTRGLLFGLGLAVGIAALTHALLSLLNWRWLLKPVLTVFLLAAASGAYFMWSYGIVIDTPMLVNVVQTDPREAADLFSWRLLVSLGLLGALPVWWLWRQPVRRVGWLGRLGGNLLSLLASVAVLVLSLMLIYQDFASVMRNHTQVRYLINPLNSFYAVCDVMARPLERDAGQLEPIGQDARVILPPAAAPATLIVVVGETARMGNFGINGYARDTTPRLAREDIVSLRNVWSCGTSTASSLPCMFSHLGKEAFENRSSNFESLVDLLHHAGLAVLWIDNQSGCKGLCDRTPNVETDSLKIADLCRGGECHDEVMLRELDRRIAELPAERRARGTVVFMHQMGSHGPAYHKRVPAAFKRFQPECASNALQECDRQQVVNAYDNTIVYTDHFLAETIGWLRHRPGPGAMVYVADHGESLGENNLYLHGLPYAIAPDVQKRVPWITWASSAFVQQRGLDKACLQQKQDVRLSHDHYFHSVMGMAGVRSAEYRPELDIYASCMKP
ncbi:MAG: phosphoethanolamine transferase [Limnohabitans sp.]